MFLLSMVTPFASIAHAGDWPQILGPDRNGTAVNETLSEWDASGPTQLWQFRVTSGFAGVAVSEQTMVLFERDDDLEIVRAHHAVTGKRLWSATSPCTYRSSISSDNGPRCVPLINQGRVYTFGAEGLLRCLQLRDGTEIWKRDTRADFSPTEGYFGVGSTPLLFGKLLIVNVGSRDNAAVVAFDADTGATVWKSFADTASYSAPIAVKIGSTDHILVVTRLNFLSLDPENGNVRFRFPFGSRGPTVNAATPMIVGNRFLLTASYGIGAVFGEIREAEYHEVWKDGDLLASQYATPIHCNGLTYAVDGRQDGGAGTAVLKCIDIENQKVLWSEKGFDYGTLIRVQEEFLFLTCGGELIRFRANAESYQEVNRSRVLDRTESGYRLPAIAGGRLYIRDDSSCRCLEVGPTNK